ncbi:histidine phosphatase family protein [Naasia lichenicola]|uniref:Histidine phosphatase family protein n=1 Tax=Naasia lichenicola TaxID=2565933 RepID=A0A4S4FRZ1_9MICO|nr:histidine phosphatase family protein [Naasia lichenicola]THG33144.1 histidine phosphatase family protein [Naasia lichenicola]
MGAVELILVRHGESEGNLAAAEAERIAAETIAVPARDADVVLSPRGREQAEALGAHLAELAADDVPQSLWVSPYLRAQQTADIALRTAGLDLPRRLDERLRDRELGITDALTSLGVERRLPLEAERRRWLGKFYYRPPGGESWADVALRVRSLLADLDREEDGRRVLIVCHDAVISLFRYVAERIPEAELLEHARLHPIPNAAITRLARPSGEGSWTATVISSAAHLAAHGADVTQHVGEPDPQEVR